LASQFITVEQRHSVAIVCINRPERLNALSREVMLELSETFKDIEKDQDLRAVILTGAGEKAFCAGTDIKELTALDEDTAAAVSQRGQALCNQIADCRMPVIAAVNGIAAGGGCELALACHLRLASPNAMFSLPETKLGALPGYGGTQRLAREIGQGRALEMMLTARAVSADEALRLGLVNRIATSAGSLLAETESLAQEISELAPIAIRACLEAVTKGAELPLAKGLALETKLFASLFATADVHEGTRAFLEKRKPVFIGS
jgi:enoyl-CoA hydratase